jgi:beta-glucanase (GH16 family)
MALIMSVLVAVPAIPAAADTTVFDDMEHGDPFGNGWFAFGGSVGGGGIAANAVDLPPSDGGAFSLETGWGSGGVPGFFGGFGRTNPTDLSGMDHFNFWINPDAGQDYTLEINLQDDDTGDDLADAAVDDEFQYDCVVSATGPCAVAGGGWQLVSIPLADFFDDNSFFTGGNGSLDAVPTSSGGNGQLINAVIAVIGNSGSDVNFRTDYWAFSTGPLTVPSQMIDDFENGLPNGTDGDGNAIGFLTFSDGSPVSIATTGTPPAPVPGSGAGNDVMALSGNVVVFAGFTHAFENDAVDTWTPQDWSSYEGIRFWFFGQDTGTGLFVDLLDNRNPGSTTDDAERFVFNFTDDFTGWQLLELPFSEFTRKEIGNGAPNDGLGLAQVHGWALGMLSTGGAGRTFYVDQVEVYGVAEIPPLSVTFASTNYEIDEGATGDIVVKLNRPMNSDDPAQVSVDYATEMASATPERDYTPTSGTLTFVNGGASQLSFPLATIDDTKWEAAETIILRLANPVDVEAGFALQARATIVENDPYDPLLLDDFERFPYNWDASENVTLSNPELADADALARPGQDSFEGVLQVEGPLAVDIDVQGNECGRGNAIVPVNLLSTPDFDATTVDHTTVAFGNATESHVNKKTGIVQRHEEDVNGDGLTDLVFHFPATDIGVDCDAPVPFNGETFDGKPITAGGSNATFSRDFALGQDWTDGQALTFWYYGTGTGENVTVNLKDNRASDPGPAGWSMVFADEFDEPAGTPPNPAYWGYEIGDGTVNGIPGWGNDELQYYTDDPANAATDGNGNLVITVDEADGSLECYYGPCDYTSARLVSKHKAEFAYGRIEARIQVPDGEAGIWPAFWSLGTDIDVVGWPQTGEIDFMEYVSRLPNEIFGTIHGPGYSGGQSFGNVYDFGGPVSNDYHTFAIEWEPDVIRWYVDGFLYHTATPADVAPNEWVFNDPVYLLLNVAVGGNFGGSVSDLLTFPQEMAVDYIRVYQGPDTAERFEASFVDSFTGWEQVTVPFTDFARSSDQPTGAPDDGLGLTEVWGYGFALPDGGLPDGITWLDQVAVEPVPPPTEITVTNLNNAGDGSLRQAIEDIAVGGTITFDPELAGGTINLTSGPIVLGRGVTIDAVDAVGISLSGQGVDRVLIVDAGTTANVANLTMSDGYGFQLAGCVLNNGELTLDRVTVTGCSMTTDAGDFWQGGGGIYNGEGATLNLIDSTVSDNTAQWSGGGVYSFFSTTTNVVRSTISGNVSNDVGGGLRLLGNAEIVNSTISGNVATGWHGGAIFQTDGDVTILNSTIANNIAPDYASSTLFIGQFGGGFVPTLTLTNTIITGNQWYACEKFASGTVGNVVSGGSNVVQDDSCNPVASDQVVADALLGPLANNGGPTLTHALLSGSPAIDAANGALCPATDQRGVARPQGAGCDVGAFERE